MKLVIFLFSITLQSTRIIVASEAGLTVTYQPLDGLGAGGVSIAQVTCNDWYCMSGRTTQIDLISAANIPPTNNPNDAKEDLNLASVCHVQFYASDIGNLQAPKELTMDVTNFVIPESISQPREDIIKAALECLRRCLPKELITTPVTLKCKESDKKWLEKIIADFNQQDRKKVFFVGE